MSNLELRTQGENISVKLKIINNYKDGFFGGQSNNSINKARIKWFKKACSDLNIHEKTTMNWDTTRVTIEVTVNGFDKANLLAREIRKELDLIDARFIKADNRAVIWIYLKPRAFKNEGKFSITNDKGIYDILPIDNSYNLKIIEKRKKSVNFEIIVDNDTELNKPQEISYNYILKESNEVEQISETKWNLSDSRTWIFICTILGGIVSFVTIKNYLYKKK